MSGAKNCPETPRQKMIAMMYLVLTAMLALNVSADILKGFRMVNQGLLTSIQSNEERNAHLMASFKELNRRYPEKIGDWLRKAQDIETISNDLFNYMQNFKFEMVKMADGQKADTAAIKIKKDDDTNVTGEYAIIKGNGEILKQKIDAYREAIKSIYKGSSVEAEKTVEYDRIFSTATISQETEKGKPITWVNANFESMPLAAAVTMLSKYQSDVRMAQTEAIQFLKNQTDAGDFRVNDVAAKVIPESKNVVQGGQYKATIILAARDTNARPEIYVNGALLQNSDGIFTTGSGGVGAHNITGYIKLKDPITGEAKTYGFNENYSVVPPSTTIANVDMNVVYMNYPNKMSISAPGFAANQLNVTASGGKLESQGNGIYICRPTGYEGVTINVSATVEGKSVNMGSQKFRVRAVPTPTAFLRYKDAAGNVVLYNPNVDSKIKPTRVNLANAEVVAEYEDGLLNASFTVQSFNFSISDNRGGYNTTASNGKDFSESQKNSLKNLKGGSFILLEGIKITGAKTATLTFPRFALP